MPRSQSPPAVRASFFLAAISAASVAADSVTLSPSRDATLYEQSAGDLANGAGEYIFTGRTGTPLTRRALIAFDVAGQLPAGATITAASLRLTMSRTPAATPRTTSLHRVLADWGEGTSDDAAQEGDGTAATTGDATWVYAFHATQTWASPGGDFAAQASATQSVGATGAYVWSGAGVVADVQAWLDEPSGNFGWLLRGDESAARTAKRFDSRQHATAANRPQLTIDYTVPATNRAPVALHDPCAVTFDAGADSATGDLAALFFDADGDVLTYAAVSSADTVIGVEVDAATLVLRPRAGGQAAVTVTATDPAGAAASVSFSAGVAFTDLAAFPDFSGSGDIIDFDDFFRFADHFGRSDQDADWNPDFDLVPNGVVDFDDFFRFADAFGARRPDPAPPRVLDACL